MNNTHKIKHTVSCSEIDSYYKLRLDYIFSHCQNIADLHSKEMGTDGKALLKKSNVFWVLTKVKLKIAEMPILDETINIETWPLRAKGVRYNREFFFSRDGKPLIMGTSEWCTLDYTTKALRRVDSVAYPQDMLYREDRSGAGSFLRMPEQICEEDYVYLYQPSFVDIDTNKHTNNVAYLKMVLNCFSPIEFEAMKIDEFQISFHTQTFYKDQIKIYKKKLNNGFYIEGRLNDSKAFDCIILNN